jgi:hypothetical protein
VFLGGWALGRWLRTRRQGRTREAAGDPLDTEPPTAAGQTAAGRPVLAWPTESRLRLFLLATLAAAVAGAAIRYRGVVPPLFAADPDAQRAMIGARSNIIEGLLSQGWTLGMAVALLRALAGPKAGRWWYVAATVVFAFGAALGASKNLVLGSAVPALVAAVSVRRPAESRWFASKRIRVIVLVGALAVTAAVVLGGQRTLAGHGAFEDQFRARYGGNPVAAGIASLDLSLSSSAETFGRLWAQRDEFPPRHGAYSVTFLGKPARRVVGDNDIYAITGELSLPYYMNTATFVAIPLLDFGPFGAAFFLLVLGLAVGYGERRLQAATGPAQQLGRGFIIYYAIFGIYELYPLIQPFWLSLVPGLVLLHLIGRRSR